ncbi:MAG: N-acetylmuramoyl-L-alanine amidase [Clostridia bacterium]|nr:N-acetylmuramoyl-L-alanine amidase [Clostridia bacterium]
MNKRVLFSLIVLTICALAFIIVIISYNSRPISPTAAPGSYSKPLLILDAGHGGADGGAVSPNGTQEAGLNLSIVLKTRDIMCFLGIPARLTRSGEGSLNHDPSKSLRTNKVADIKARLAVSREYPDCDFISVHLNKFSQSKYRGAQVFYGLLNERSATLAQSLQDALRSFLDPDNNRKIKPSPDSVFLMKNIKAPAVTVECGFLSNEEEEKKLLSDDYRKQTAIAVACGYALYLKEG